MRAQTACQRQYEIQYDVERPPDTHQAKPRRGRALFCSFEAQHIDEAEDLACEQVEQAEPKRVPIHHEKKKTFRCCSRISAWLVASI